MVKKLLVGLAILAILLAGAWFGAETWMSKLARDAIAGRQDVSAEITPLRQPGRLGLRMGNVAVSESAGSASFPTLDGYIRLLSPSTLTVDLPDQVTLTPADSAPTTVGISQGRAEITVSATRGFAISHAGISGRDLIVDEMPIADSINAEGRLSHMGSAAPAGSVASYRVNLSGSGLMLGVLPDRLDVTGTMQVWLDALPDRAALNGSGPLPQPTGLQTRGLNFTLGDLQARLAGRVEADDQGLATGQAAIYTTDGPAFVEAAVNARLLTSEVAAPLQTLLTNAAGAAADATDVDSAANPGEEDENALAEEIVTLPPAGPGEIRLPIFMQDGVIRLGPVPLGPAPRIAGF